MTAPSLADEIARDVRASLQSGIFGRSRTVHEWIMRGDNWFVYERLRAWTLGYLAALERQNGE